MTTEKCSGRKLFLIRSAELLRQYRSWLKRVLDLLPEDRLWWGPSENVNSIGVLLKHLRGNLRQWVVSALGNVPFHREREKEFLNTEESLEDLWNAIDETISEAIKTLESLDENILCEHLQVQGFEVTGLEAIYHAIEHFAYHTGQIVFITKMITGGDTQFYVLGEDGHPKPNW
ncbi:MAG: DUF1572 domain-containing protein [Chlorobi bacterium]|nr:DUF1572 domain-containing protein [Chlorobiota bacterium]